ncbi:MAG: HAMP domain-containing protein [Cyanobacteria bacterium SIG27]|nr:HAMP domain-containing protein [Cyanobacteria bacterium SIG27]
MKKIDFTNFKQFKFSISVYLAVLMGLVIAFVATVLMFITFNSVKNLVGEYESESNRLTNYLAAIVTQSISMDVDKKGFKSTKNLINFYRSENLLAYIYIKNNNTDEIVLGKDEYRHNDVQVANVKELSRTIGDYTLYYGVSSKDRVESYLHSLFELVAYALFLIIVIASVAAVIFASIISKPLKDVSSAAKKITDGEFDVKIKKSQFSEIDDLVYSCNEMAFQLNELYSSLELKVQERTIALEAANHKLQETQAMMVHSEKMRSLGELVAGIAHEINNPINFIHGNIMILQNYAKDLIGLIDLYEENNLTIPDDIKKKIEDFKNEIDLDFLRDDINDLIKSCIEGTQRTKNIVLDLKNFSRMEEMVLTQFDIPKEIDTTLNILNNKYKNRITVIKNYHPDTPKIEAYGGQLNQVFMNILDNAQDAMAEAGTLTINTYMVDKNVKIEFIDTGAGIPEENLKRIFDPFFTTKAVGKGTGLGMSISYRVINDHNGTIEVESEVGKGTKFTITLPINHEKKEELSLEEEIIKDLREENGVEQ